MSSVELLRQPNTTAPSLEGIARRVPDFRNWTGNVTAAPRAFLLPKDDTELRAIVLYARAHRLKVRVVGSGHSFTPLVATQDLLVSLDNYGTAIVLDHDPVTSEVTVNAGAKLYMLGDALWDLGLGLPNMGDIDRQSVGGAVGTGTHGTGVTLGNISSFVVGLRLLTASGEFVDASPTQNPEVFKAAQVSFGALGIITAVRFKLVPRYSLHLLRTNEPLERVLNELDSQAATHRNFELFWNPTSDVVTVQRLNIVDAPRRRSGFGRWIKHTVVETWAFLFIIWLATVLPFLRKPLTYIAANGMTPMDEVERSYRIFAHERIVRFYEMEYTLPREHGRAILEALAKFVRTNGITLFFPIEYRYVQADDIPLSPMAGRDSVTVSIHMELPGPRALRERYFAGMEQIFRAHGGRPHWGKMHSLGEAELRGMYPGWDAFQKVRDALDPERVFSTPEMARLLGA